MDSRTDGVAFVGKACKLVLIFKMSYGRNVWDYIATKRRGMVVMQ